MGSLACAWTPSKWLQHNLSTVTKRMHIGNWQAYTTTVRGSCMYKAAMQVQWLLADYRSAAALFANDVSEQHISKHHAWL